jgi:hypothetical protein
MAGNVEAAEEVLASRYAGEDESVEMMATRGRYESRRGHIEAGEAGYRDAARLARRKGKLRVLYRRCFWS